MENWQHLPPTFRADTWDPHCYQHKSSMWTRTDKVRGQTTPFLAWTHLISFLLTGNTLPPISPVVCHPGWAPGVSHLRPVIWSSLMPGSCHPLQSPHWYSSMWDRLRARSLWLGTMGDKLLLVSKLTSGRGWINASILINPTLFHSILCKCKIQYSFWAHTKSFTADSCHIDTPVAGHKELYTN